MKPETLPEKTYLGDGVYAYWDGISLVLTTENGIKTTNRIILDPQVYESLVEFVERLCHHEDERES